jgi:molybdopterin converting factor small subunit
MLKRYLNIYNQRSFGVKHLVHVARRRKKGVVCLRISNPPSLRPLYFSRIVETYSMGDVVFRCYVFGEVRAMIGATDYVEARLPLDAREVSPAVVWSGVVDGVLRSAASRPRLQEQLRAMLEVCLLAIDDEFMDRNDTASRVTSLENVAVIPPVSGG